jgi:hypothetical protein
VWVLLRIHTKLHSKILDVTKVNAHIGSPESRA